MNVKRKNIEFQIIFKWLGVDCKRSVQQQRKRAYKDVV